MNVVKEIQRINQKELNISSNVSWHDEYAQSAYVFAGNLDFGLTEGDIRAVFEQYDSLFFLMAKYFGLIFTYSVQIWPSC